MKKIILASVILASSCLAIEVGKLPSPVTLSGKSGGLFNGKAWSSKMLKGKVHIVFYVDPDMRKVNEKLSQTLKKRHFNRKHYEPVAIINLAATWMPDAVLEMKIKSKQKAFPDTVYVKDKDKTLVKKWKLADDNSDILLFDKKGKLIYKKFGKLSDKEIATLMALIEKNL